MSDHLVIEGITCNAAGYYEIDDADALTALATYVNGGGTTDGLTFKLTDDIDMISVENFAPIGNTSANAFKGTYDGDNHKIGNLVISDTGSAAGLFGYVGSGGTVKGVTLEDANITSTGYVGGITGRNEGGTIEDSAVFELNVNSSGTPTQSAIGALVGKNDQTDPAVSIGGNHYDCRSGDTLLSAFGEHNVLQRRCDIDIERDACGRRYD